MLSQVKTVVFDKTGTLTHGKPVVTRVVLFVAEAMCPHQLFTAIVGLAENNSEHPLGVAITNFAKGVSLICNHVMHCVTCVCMKPASPSLSFSLPPSLPPSLARSHSLHPSPLPPLSLPSLSPLPPSSPPSLSPFLSCPLPRCWETIWKVSAPTLKLFLATA